MKRYDPERADLAPRDEVARAMYREMENEGSDYLLLDARLAAGSRLEERFPGIFEKCMSVGLDIRREPIPVVPAAHYFCGGVKVGLTGRTSVAGLYAAGETACTGVHGANRLASVSLLEGLFFGHAAGKDAAENLAPVLDCPEEEHPRLGVPCPRGGVRSRPDPAGHAQHPVHDVELRRHHPQQETPGARPGGPQLPQPPDRAVLRAGRRSAVRSSSCATPCWPRTSSFPPPTRTRGPWAATTSNELEAAVVFPGEGGLWDRRDHRARSYPLVLHRHPVRHPCRQGSGVCRARGRVSLGPVCGHQRSTLLRRGPGDRRRRVPARHEQRQEAAPGKPRDPLLSAAARSRPGRRFPSHSG